MLPDRVLAGVWRFGVETRDGERAQDWFGLGLAEIDIDGTVQQVRLPPLPSEWENEAGRRWLVTGIVPVPGRPEVLHLLVWNPWDTWCAEYEILSGNCRMVSDARFLVEQVRAIARYRSSPESVAADPGPVLLAPPPGIGRHHYPHNRLEWFRNRLTPVWAFRRLWGWRLITEPDPTVGMRWFPVAR